MNQSEQIRHAALSWLNSLGIRDPEELSLADYEQVKKLLGNDRPGFGIFISMMMFERQKAVAQLTNADLSNSAGAVAAAKLQGIVMAVDTMRELILNIADPIGEGSDPDMGIIAGVRFDDRASEQPAVG